MSGCFFLNSVYINILDVNDVLLWRLFSSVLSRDKGLCQPASTDINADKLAEFFVEKVELVCAAAAVVSSP